MTDALILPAEGHLAPAEPPPLEARGVVKRWGGREVLAGIDLTLTQGTLTWVGGANGAGKTTLLRIVAGLICPDAGEVRVHGLHAERDRRTYQGRLGYLPAGNGGLYARLSVRDNLDLWSGLALLPRRTRPAAIASAIERFGLAQLASNRVDRLSTGQRQRVRLAMTFLHAPDLLLLDEPHTSLDEDGLALLHAELQRVRERGATTVWCSPTRIDDLAADRACVIEEGVLRAA